MDYLCSFCVEHPKSPIKLQCQHVLCAKCAYRCAQGNPGATEIECFICNQVSGLDVPAIEDSPQKFCLPKTSRNFHDDQLKICQKSITFILNQQQYMKHFIDSQIESLILQLQERQSQLTQQLSDYLSKKLAFYQEIEQKILAARRAPDNRQQFSVELYENDRIMDFSNLRILTEEIKKFGRRIVAHPTPQTLQKSTTSRTPQRQKRKTNITNKENLLYIPPVPLSNLQLPSLQNATLHYKLGMKYTIPRFNRVLGMVIANGYRFGWYWDVDNIRTGYNSGDVYIFTLENCYGTLPMKFIPKKEQSGYALYLHGSRIGFGKEGRDLTIDLEDLRHSHSELGHGFSLVGELNGSIVLAGRKSNWTVESLEIYCC